MGSFVEEMLTVCAGKCFLEGAAFMPGLKGKDKAVVGRIPMHSNCPKCSNAHMATRTGDSDFHSLLSVLLSSSLTSLSP